MTKHSNKVKEDHCTDDARVTCPGTYRGIIGKFIDWLVKVKGLHDYPFSITTAVP